MDAIQAKYSNFIAGKIPSMEKKLINIVVTISL